MCFQVKTEACWISVEVIKRIWGIVIYWTNQSCLYFVFYKYLSSQSGLTLKKWLFIATCCCSSRLSSSDPSQPCSSTTCVVMIRSCLITNSKGFTARSDLNTWGLPQQRLWAQSPFAQHWYKTVLFPTSEDIMSVGKETSSHDKNTWQIYTKPLKLHWLRSDRTAWICHSKPVIITHTPYLPLISHRSVKSCVFFSFRRSVRRFCCYSPSASSLWTPASIC